MLKSRFKMTDLEPISNILGISVKREGETRKIYLSQKLCVEKLLDKFNMEDLKVVLTPLDPSLTISKDMCSKTKEERNEMRNLPY